MSKAQDIKNVIHKANTEYWQNSHENDIEYSKGNKRPNPDLSVPDLITKRVLEYLKLKLPKEKSK